jgi:hypothetical protein
MDRRARIGSVVVGVGALLLGGVFAATRSGPEQPPPEPPARRPAPARPAEPVEAPKADAPAGSIGSGAAIDLPCRPTPMAPLHDAPPLGLDDLGDERGGQTSVSVDPLTGLATVWERDVEVAGLPALRRARTLGDGSRGLLGRGWRSEVDASLHRKGELFVVVRLDGAMVFEPAPPGCGSRRSASCSR